MLNLVSAVPKKEKIRILVIPVCEDRQIHRNKTIVSLAKMATPIKEFSGESNEHLLLYLPEDGNVERVLFLGVGKFKKLDPEALRKVSGKAVQKCIGLKLSDALIAVPQVGEPADAPGVFLEAMAEAACLGNHVFDTYKKEKKKKPLDRVGFLVSAKHEKAFSQLPGRIETVCRSVIRAREWVSTPANDKRPDQFVKVLENAAADAEVKITVMDEAELVRKQFGAILAVGMGSSSKPAMVVLDYSPKGAKKTIALVGKGVMFDSGGINLKPPSSARNMKTDMAGAAAVAATVIVASGLGHKNRIVGAIPIVENMPSGTAARPGDIVRTYAGKTVEIGNTDAEGRLILADALAYAVEKYKPDAVVDVATLTGACVVALGAKIAGMFSNDDDLARAILRSGEKTGERCWRMSLPEDYRENLKSDVADLGNVAKSGSGGAITAALFLSEFVNDTKWAHIDIAGPSFATKQSDYCGPGGTGFGVRLLWELIESL